MDNIQCTCFQLMCQGGNVHFKVILNILSNFDSEVLSLSLDSFTIYGKNGFKTKIDYNNQIDFSIIGSIHCKLIGSNGNKLSVIFFRSGKIKIAGGLMNITHNNLELYIQTVTNSICTIFTDHICKEYKISLINAIFRIALTPQLFRQFIYYLQESRIFYYVKQPTFTGRGNITCARVYPFNGRKCHLSVDPKGVIQLFAFQSFSELHRIAHSFLAKCAAHNPPLSPAPPPQSI